MNLAVNYFLEIVTLLEIAFDRNSLQHYLDIYFIRRFKDSMSKEQSRRIYNNPF
jgi:hypothetical protein